MYHIHILLVAPLRTGHMPECSNPKETRIINIFLFAFACRSFSSTLVEYPSPGGGLMEENRFFGFEVELTGITHIMAADNLIKALGPEAKLINPTL